MEAGLEQCKEPDDEILCELSVDLWKFVDSMVKFKGRPGQVLSRRTEWINED
jgi:hypothetical protein